MTNAKEKIRKKFLSLRNRLFSLISEAQKDSIIQNLVSLEEFKNANCILAYFSKDSEVPTLKLIEKLLQEKKIVCLPRTDFESKLLIPRRINSFSDLSKNKFGVYEPKPECLEVEPSKIDLAIVPGIVFDRNGYRLGYGYGFYDRFLSNKNFFKIGLAFSFQIIEQLPFEEHDVRLDCIVSEKEIIRLKK